MSRASPALCLLAVLAFGCTPAPAPTPQPKRPVVAVRPPVPGQAKKQRPGQAKKQAEREAGVARWVAALEQPAPRRRKEAADEIARIGRRYDPEGKRLIPALAKALDVPADFDVWKKDHPGLAEKEYREANALSGAITEALIHFGPKAGPALLAAVATVGDRSGPAADTFRHWTGAALQRWADEMPAPILDAAADWRLSRAIEIALEGIGPASVPALRQALGDRRPALRARSAVLLAKIGPAASEAAPALRALLKDADPNVRLAAAYALCGRVADERARAFPVLLALFHDTHPAASRLRPLAGWSFSTDPRAALTWVAAHHNGVWWAPGPTSEARAWAAAALLAEFGPKAESMVPRLRTWVRQTPTSYPVWAGTVIRLGPTARRLAPDLVDALRRAPARGPRSRASEGLGPVWAALRSMGSAAAEDKRVVPALLVMLKEDPASARAVLALHAIGPAAGQAAADALRGLLRHDEPEVRWRAYWALAAIAPVAAAAEVPGFAGVPPPHLVTATDAVRPRVRLDVWLRMERSSTPWWNARSQERHRVALTDAIRRLGLKDRAAVPLLVALLGGDVAPQGEILDFLVRVGPTAAGDVVPVLLRILASQRPNPYSERYTLCLERLGAAAAPALTRALSDRDHMVRSKAVAFLGKLGPDAKAAVPALRTALMAARHYERSALVETLGRIGPAARTAVPDLIALFRAESKEWPEVERNSWRTTLARALSRIGKDAVPPLIDALKDADLHTRAGAAEALGRIGPEARPAVVYLLRLRDNASEPYQVRGAARAALKVLDPD